LLTIFCALGLKFRRVQVSEGDGVVVSDDENGSKKIQRVKPSQLRATQPCFVHETPSKIWNDSRLRIATARGAER
jgi:hypothetical protein